VETAEEPQPTTDPPAWLVHPVHELQALIDRVYLSAEEGDLGRAAALIKGLRERERDLATIRQSCEARLLAAMAEQGADKMVTFPGPRYDDRRSPEDAHTYVVTRRVSKRRAKVDNPGLLRAVKALARKRLTVDADTGEIESPEVKTLDMLEEAFRLEPRWSVLAGWGIDDEDFCGDTSYSEGVKVET